MVGGAPHTHAHACMHMHTHAFVVPCKWPPPLHLGKFQGFPMMSYVHAHACAHTCICGSMQMAAPIAFGEIPGIPYDVICACACMCTCVGGTLSPPPNPHPPTPHPPGGTLRISQNSMALELIEIFQFCLKI